MKSLGFDPGTEAEFGGGHLLAETYLDQADDGRYFLTVVDDHGSVLISLSLRPDFLDALIAARTREAAA